MIDKPRCHTVEGNSGWTNGGSAPQTFAPTASNTNSTHTVAIRRASGEALRIRRSSSRSVARPSTAVAATATTNNGSTGQPLAVENDVPMLPGACSCR